VLNYNYERGQYESSNDWFWWNYYTRKYIS
jgi:hypothetical protein